MTLFQRFVEYMVNVISPQRSKPLWVDRVEMAKDEGEKMVVILLRCNAMLSNFMFSVRPFEFPIPFLLNVAEYTRWITAFGQGWNVMSEPSELSRAALVDVLGGNLCGAELDLDTQVFRVPRATFSRFEEKGQYPPGEHWAIALLDRSIPGIKTAKYTGIAYHIIHIPEQPWSELTNEQKIHVAHLAVGWNYARVLTDDYIRNFIIFMDSVTYEADTVVSYR